MNSKLCTILLGDCLDRLRELPDESVQCCVTSPPYFGLRDYGVAGQIGLEESPWEYIDKMVAVFQEVRRVLRHDGTCWINLGDTYAGSGKGYGGSFQTERRAYEYVPVGSRKPPGGFKRKDLMGMPWRIALALQADGWYLRSDIIWHKPNPMPESISDRPTKSHEYIFLLTKSEDYFYDAEAIKDPVTGNAHSRGNGVNPKAAVPNIPKNWDISKGEGGHGNFHKNGRGKNKQNPSFSAALKDFVGTRNKRTVWTVPAFCFHDAHFATYPPDLIKPCILAGTSGGGCCVECGAPLRRIIRKKRKPNLEHQRQCGGDLNGEYHGAARKDYASAKAQDPSAIKARILAGMRERITVGWKRVCKCDSETRPCLVLDPFTGSGTTGEVALELGRRFVGIELNPDYLPMIERRTRQAGLQL